MDVTNSKRDTENVSADSDTDSRSDSDPGDDEALYIRAPDTWHSTSDPGDEGLAGHIARLPGFVVGAANGLVTQPNATTKNDETEIPPSMPAPRYDDAQNKETETLPPAPAPLCDKVSKDTAGAPLVEVPALPPSQPVGTGQDMHLVTLFGSEDDNNDEVVKLLVV